MGSPAPSAIAAKLFFFSGLVGIMLTTACKKAPEVKATETKVPELVPAEITPPGWIRPQVSFLRKPGIDLAGPAAVPNGEPDLSWR